MSSFFGALSLLRPTDEALSAEAAFQIQVHRLLTLLGAAGISLFGAIRALSSGGGEDLLGVRLAVVALLCTLVGASYVSFWVRRTYVQWMRIAMYVFMAWFGVVAALNAFAGSYAVGLLLTYAVLMAAVGLGARSLRPVLWFAGFGLALVIAGVLMTPAPQMSPVFLLASIATVAATQIAVIYGRLTARDSLEQRTERLKRTSARLEALFESSPDMINVHDKDGNLIDPNPRLREKTDYDEEALAEMKVWDLDEAIDPEAARSLWSEMGSGDRREWEGRFRRRDGSTFPVEVHIRRLDLEGEDRFLVVSRDISRRKRREEELRHKEHRYEAVFDDPNILVGRIAPDGRLLQANATAMEYVEASEEEVVGELFWQTPWWGDDVRPLIREKVRQAAEGQYVEFEAEHVMPDGEARTVNGTIRPVRGQEDHVISLFATGRDVTERRRREEELERYREYTDRRLDAIDDLFFVHDSDGSLRRWNESFAEVTGYTDEELAGMDAVNFVPESYRERRADVIERVHEEGNARLEAPLLCKDGTTIPYEFAASSIEHPDGEVRLVGIGRDVSERKARERDLRQSRERWQKLVESHKDGIQISIGGVIRYINAAGAQILGAERAEEVVGEPLGRFLGAEQGPRETLDERLHRLRRGEPTRPHEQRVVGLDGKSRIVESYSVPIEFEGRAATQTILRDVTARREMEERLRERRQKIESLYSETNRLLRADTRQTVCERIHGMLRDVFGYPLTAIGFAENGLLVPERVTLPDGSLMSDAQAYSIDGQTVAARTYRSGEPVVVEEAEALDYEAAYDGLRSAAGIPMGDHGVLVIGQVECEEFDPFDLQLIEILAAQATVVMDGLARLDALQESERRFREIFENAAVGIGVLDAEGHILEANPVLSKMMQYTVDEMEGTHFAKLTHPEDVDTDQQRFEELVAEERDHYQMEKRYVRADGSVFWGRLTVSRHEGRGEGQVVGMVEDIDDQKRYEAELREAKEDAERMNRLKTAFLANMSHEIRTPLTSIIGFAEAIGDEVGELQERLDSPELGSLSRFSGLIKQGGERLMETLDAVLNLSKLEAGEMELTIEPVDLASEVEEAADLFERQAEEAGVDLRMERPDRPVWGQVDEAGLRIALRNLVSNAIKYTEDGGQVWIRAGRENGDAILEVEDTGVGMDPDQVPELFEAFKQESEGVGREYEGSGLGLAVTRRVVVQMGGAIDVATEKGEGTCFTVQVPLREPENAQ